MGNGITPQKIGKQNTHRNTGWQQNDLMRTKERLNDVLFAHGKRGKKFRKCNVIVLLFPFLSSYTTTAYFLF